MEVLAITFLQNSFWLLLLIHQHPLQSIGNWTAKLKAQARKSARPGVNLCREFATVLSGHHSLDVLDDARNHAAVIVELLCAIRHLDASLFADELVVRALIDVLKAPPTAYVVDEDGLEIGLVRANIVKKLG